ncbi:glycosyltransferase [Microbacterium pygmaeum]|uniref:Glycosyltransferase involved in cell wall bisynthesis n=1 Tax=Microbacterium pygmaeum TaxID=370764 RepID=A0A1G7TDJ8_9MICO|nr:glycosyltransferase [Microbacterium pygmaeum]SDG33104.1 Glycosyltransferase involved in cell wall bisynthesis [Microbacterium pygmaeum]SDH63221.1 Glycosyltransferase involved in cell wall bisynthesis [Microbacterium pygmaeum]
MTKSVAIIGTRGYPSYYGGFETAVRYLAPYLVDQGWDVDVYSRRGATKPEDARLDPRVNVRYTRGVEMKSVSTLTYGLTASLDAARRRPDVALVMNVANGYWLPILRAAGIPSLVNVDGIEWERAKWSGLGKAVFRRGAQLTARYGSNLVFDAHAIGDRWKRDFNRDGFFIPYGGDAMTPGDLDPGLVPGDYVLIVARFVPENTVPEFLEAAKIIARKHDVVIVGSSGYGGPIDDAAKLLDEQEPRVRWLGHLSDDKRLAALWQNAGAYFHGHSVGGTNPALVQAMANKAPVVARDTVYNREVLEDAGVFVQPDPAAIASAVIDLISDSAKRQRLIERGSERAESIYSWERVCASYAEALDVTRQAVAVR